MPILTGAQTIWERGTIPRPPQQYTKPGRGWNKTSAKIVGSILYYARAVDMTILMALSPQLHRNGANESHQLSVGSVHVISGSFSKQRHSEGEISRIGNDHEHTLQCIIPFGSGSVEPHMRPFFHGVDAEGQKPIKLSGTFHTSMTVM